MGWELGITLVVGLIGSGGVSALVTHWMTAGAAREQERRSALVQQVELREGKHAEANERLLPLMRDVLYWISREEAGAAESERNFVVVVTPPIGDVTNRDEALRVLREVAVRHPTREVRRLADKLYVTIFASGVDPFDEPAEEFDRLGEWAKQASDIIELMHLPEVMDDADKRAEWWGLRTTGVGADNTNTRLLRGRPSKGGKN
jgi:hypothetical protein